MSHRSSVFLCTLAVTTFVGTVVGSCAGGDSGAPLDAGSIDNACASDPLKDESFSGFCEDRVDDNCRTDVGDPDDCSLQNSATHHHCATADEPCPATQPMSAPPVWDCTGTPPEGVIAHAKLDEETPHVQNLCVYVYATEALPDEHYVALIVDNGVDPRGPDGLCNGLFMERRFLFFTDDDVDCAPTNVLMGAPVDDQPLSTSCRKMVRRLWDSDANFDPDIQFFAGSRDEALKKLDVLDSAEIACVGYVNQAGEPARADLGFASQAKAPIVVVVGSD